MDSRLPHLLLPVSLSQLLNQFFLRASINLYMKSPVDTFSPQKALPTGFVRMKVATPARALPIDFQLLIRRR
jgi:hypothetical protein